MRPLDAAVLVTALAGFVAYGFWRSRGVRDVDTHLVAGRRMPWAMVALSIMATQASAVTFMATPGQGFTAGLSFVQFYFGLPIAMVVLSATLVPLFQRHRVSTAYEFLEHRFDGKTRTLAAGLFLVQRGLAAGITLYAPSLVLSVVLHWNLGLTCALLGALVVGFTALGGARAVSHTHALQFSIILATMVLAFALVVRALPAGVGWSGALSVAGAAGRLNAVDLTFDPKSRYNLWAGLIGGCFLQLAYFGTDQSQVGRILTARDTRESRRGLLMNGLLKVPMQAAILLLGVLVFVFYAFHPSPMFFDPAGVERARAGVHAAEWSAAERDWRDARAMFGAASLEAVRARRAGDAAARRTALAAADVARTRADQARTRGLAALRATDPGANVNDTNYVFLEFVLSVLPAGIVGLVLAALFAASMNSTSSELSALASTTVVDVVRRVRPGLDEAAQLAWSRGATVFWAVFAVAFSQVAAGMGSLVEAVNVIGSLFYGTMLGIFLSGFFLGRVGGSAVFAAAVVGEAAVIACWRLTPISFLWYNAVGCLVTMAVAALLASLVPGMRARARPA